MAMRLGMLMVLAGLYSAGAWAGDVRIRAAELGSDGRGSWTAHVTLEHGDTGWEHYADAWRVLGPDGTVLGCVEFEQAVDFGDGMTTPHQGGGTDVAVVRFDKSGVVTDTPFHLGSTGSDYITSVGAFPTVCIFKCYFHVIS